MSICPVCEHKTVPPYGNPQSKILIVGEFPAEKELEKGRPFASGAGLVLRQELAAVGIDLVQCRTTNLWLHPMNDDENCFKYGYDLILEEAKNKSAILLIGSECADIFVQKSVSDICGLRVEELTPFSAQIVMSVFQTAMIYHNKGLGEIRLALKKFAKYCKEENII